MLSSLCEIISTAQNPGTHPRTWQLTLVNIGLHIVNVLVLLVGHSVHGSIGPGRQLRVGVLGDVLIGLLGSSGTGALDSLRDVVGGVLTCISMILLHRDERCDTLTVSMAKLIVEEMWWIEEEMWWIEEELWGGFKMRERSGDSWMILVFVCAGITALFILLRNQVFCRCWPIASPSHSLRVLRLKFSHRAKPSFAGES